MKIQLIDNCALFTVSISFEESVHCKLTKIDVIKISVCVCVYVCMYVFIFILHTCMYLLYRNTKY